MTEQPILFIHNWDKWQSYRGDRGQPPWIKVHRSLLRERKWIQLSDEQRGQLLSIWLLAADEAGCVPNDPAFIKMVCCLRSEPDLKLFIELGFLDAKVTPPKRQGDLLEKSRGETETEKKQNSADAPAFTKEFTETFWPKYPHKIGKAAALKAYLSARSKCTEAEIVSGVERYTATKPHDRPWCNPATFLNQERWLDQPAEVATAGARRNGTGYYVKLGSSQADAWQRYAHKHNDPLIYKFRGKADGDEVHVPSEWPPR
jgi:hypothetical protein